MRSFCEGLVFVLIFVVHLSGFGAISLICSHCKTLPNKEDDHKVINKVNLFSTYNTKQHTYISINRAELTELAMTSWQSRQRCTEILAKKQTSSKATKTAQGKLISILSVLTIRIEELTWSDNTT